MIIKVTTQGITPIIINKFTDAAAIKATEGNSSILKGDNGSPRDQCELKLHKGLKGQCIIPGPNVFSCIIAAGVFHKAGKTKMTTQKSSLIPSCLSIQEIEIDIVSKDSWCVDTRPVRNPATGGRFLCHRPIFNDWELTFHIELYQSFMSEKLCRQLIDDAGKRMGLGDFRPSRKGPYGKFVVKHWSVV